MSVRGGRVYAWLKNFRARHATARAQKKWAGVRVHFIGIGGSGMSSLAELLLLRGAVVSGSDLQDGPSLQRLRALGALVRVGHSAVALAMATRVVFSTAIPAHNPELQEARRRKLPCQTRGALLAELMRDARGIAVAGTHGKTTTAALIAHLLIETGGDPSAVIGGRTFDDARAHHHALPTRSGARLGGGGDWFVAEADESDGSFLQLAPQIAVVTNIEAEHLDHYGELAALDDAFVAFINSARVCAVLNTGDAGVRRILPRVTRPWRSVGGDTDASLRAQQHGGARADGGESLNMGETFEVTNAAQRARVALPLLGQHNIANALTALGVALATGASLDAAARALASFRGVARRFEERGVAAGVRVVDDYGHHPSEICATLKAARTAHARFASANGDGARTRNAFASDDTGRTNFASANADRARAHLAPVNVAAAHASPTERAHTPRERGRLVVAFQPHRYTRTRALFDGFVAAFDDADLVVLTEIDAAGEEPLPGVSAAALASALRARGASAVRFEPHAGALPQLLARELRAGDMLLTLGAGNIHRLGPAVLARLRERAS